ncbi:LPS-assembly protein LptD [Flavobacteriaceae bacterium F08102]|nr:LPS-assembly protein LptD [Flavobacteriaceae bacterium F08102]
MHTNFTHIVFVFLLFCTGYGFSYAQINPVQKNRQNQKIGDTTKRDTLPPIDSLKPSDSLSLDTIKPKETLEGRVRDKSADQMTYDFINRIGTLYDQAELYYQDIELKAGEIIIDYRNNLAYAKGIVDSLGNYTQRPQFKQGAQETEQDSLIYNFKNEKAIIYNAKTLQQGIIVGGEITKRENDSVFYIDKAHFTTSTKPKPDYEIVTRNIKVVPGKKIVGGLSQLKLADVPTPAILPFFYVPITKENAASGFLIPTWGDNNNQGFFLQNGGYYFAISDYIDLAVLGDIYSNGSWGVRFDSNYNNRYRYSGTFSLRFENLLTSQRGFSDYSKRNNFYVRWSHSQAQQASPNSRFQASVNLGSSQYFRESNNEYNISQQVTNTFSSSISYSKSFVGTPFNMSLSLNHTQNTNTEQINMTLPSLQLSMDRIYPFASKSGTKSSALEKIGLTYNLDAKNSISISEDQFLKDGMFENARTGAKHSISASTNMKALNYITISPSARYEEVWYLKTIDQQYDEFNNTIVRDTLNGFDAFRQYSGGVSASTTVYGMFHINKGRLKTIRHVMRPSVSYNYRPDFGQYYEEVQQSEDPNDLKTFNRFDGGVFGAPSRGISNSLGFTLNNTLEAKVTPKDSTATDDKIIKILNSFNLSTSYNMAADSLKWSPVRLTTGTVLFNNKLNVNGGATLDPYAINANGTKINTFNIDNGGSLLRLTGANLSLSYSISSKDLSKHKDTSTQQQQETQEDPTSQSLFGSNLSTHNVADDQDQSTKKVAKLYGASVPWNLSFRYNVNYANARSQNEISNNSLQFSGNVELTPKWSVSLSSGYDFKQKGVTYTNLSFERDLDSWRMSFNWVPFGNSQTYYFYIGVKSSVLSDIKYDQRKVPDKRLF